MSNFFDKITSSIFSSSKSKRKSSTDSEYNNDKPQNYNNTKPNESLSEKDIIERREAIVKAAADRSKQWDKKIQTGKKATVTKQAVNSNFNGIDNDLISEDTIKSIERSKEYEKLEAQRLGFNPYAPVSSSGSQASAVTSVTAMNIVPTNTNNNTTSKSNNNIPSNSIKSNSSSSNTNENIIIDEILVDDSVIDAVNQAFSIILNNNVEKETSQSIEVSLQTIFKLLNNLNNNRNELKYRSVRLSNPSIQSKIVNVNGAMDILLAAGFKLSCDDNKASSTENEMYLRHPMTDLELTQLLYTINRLKEILE